MKVAIMQPYFFPYIGQFQLINMVDRFILMDDVQYIRHGWVNRNRILNPADGVQYIIVPVRKHTHDTPIKRIVIANNHSWQRAILGQLQQYKQTAPYFTDVFKLVSECLSTNETSIARLNGHCFELVCNYIGIRFRKEIASTINLDYSEVKQTQDWALQVSRQLGATAYYNPPGGMKLYSKEHFAEYDIDLHFVVPQLNSYDQGVKEFTPGLSIVDVMMYNSPSSIKHML